MYVFYFTKINRKIHAAHRQKKNLEGLYEFLAPGITVVEPNLATGFIKEPNKSEITVRKSDVAKFRTKHETDTDLAHYAVRWPPKINEKILEQKAQNNNKDLSGRDLGSKKVKRFKKQSDKICVVFAAPSCISTTSNVAWALKMRIPKRNSKLDDAFKDRPDLTQVCHFSPKQFFAAPSTQPFSFRLRHPCRNWLHF